MRTPENDPSIEQEPHLRGGGYAADPSEAAASDQLGRAARRETEDDRVEHTVWDEPGVSPAVAGPPPEAALTYARWIQRRIDQTTASRSWLLAAAIALAAGPWAILGALGSGHRTIFAVLMVTVFGPVIEEMLKVALPLWVVEKRPFWFRSRLQIALCVLASGLVFAAVENVLYLHVYVAKPSELLIRWRWSACVALHMGCSLIAGLGLMRIWMQAIEDRRRPELTVGARYLVGAMVLHGAYNAFAVLLSLFRYEI